MLVDLHIHTKYSHDSWAEVSDILDTAEKRGLDAVAITDHDTVEGAKEAKQLAAERDIRIITGVERTIPAGEHGCHLIGLHVNQLPPNDNITSFINGVHNQGGVVVIPHPFRTGTGLFYHKENGTISQSAATLLLERASLVESLNWKDSLSAMSQSLNFANKSTHGIVAGTDAHTSGDVGKLTTKIESSRSIKQGGKIIAPVQDPATIELNSLPERLQGRSTRSRDSKFKTQIISSVASLMNLIPGNEPNHTTKRMLQRFRATFENVINKQPPNSGGSYLAISRREGDGDLLLEPIKVKIDA